MNKKIILVAGYSAAGKTTFAARLSKELSIPYLSKDQVKIALNRSFPVNNREDSKRLSAIAFDAMLFTTERFMEVCKPIILEANFVMKENHNGLKEGEALRSLITQYGYQALTYIFLGELPVLYERFAKRDVLPERGVANMMWGNFSYEDYLKGNMHLSEFNVGGKIIQIDTTDFETANFDENIKIAYRFMEENYE